MTGHKSDRFDTSGHFGDDNPTGAVTNGLDNSDVQPQKLTLTVNGLLRTDIKSHYSFDILLGKLSESREKKKENHHPGTHFAAGTVQPPAGDDCRCLAFARPANSYALLVAFPCGILKWRDRLAPQLAC